MVNRKQLKGTDKTKYDLFDAITAITKQVKSTDELKRQLLSKGIEMQFKYKSGTKEVQGVSFSNGDAKFKGSEIDRSLSYGRICNTIDQNVQQEETEQLRHQRFVSDLKDAINHSRYTSSKATIKVKAHPYSKLYYSRNRLIQCRKLPMIWTNGEENAVNNKARELVDD